MSGCGSCHAPIVWAVTTTGERMPLDPQPHPGGNVRLDRSRTPLVAKVVGATIDMFDPDDDGTRWITHFATCPDADSWRSER